MTGELFDVLRSHSVLNRSLEDSTDLDRDPFERGLAASRRRVAATCRTCCSAFARCICSASAARSP
jgi:2-keto-3-deoxy-galactonokinase